MRPDPILDRWWKFTFIMVVLSVWSLTQTDNWAEVIIILCGYVSIYVITWGHLNRYSNPNK